MVHCLVPVQVLLRYVLPQLVGSLFGASSSAPSTSGSLVGASSSAPSASGSLVVPV